MGKVYLLKTYDQHGDPMYKIGHTSRDVSKRVSELSTGCPFDISVHAVFESDYAGRIERNLHRAYSHKRHRGEWFVDVFDSPQDFLDRCASEERMAKVNKEVTESMMDAKRIRSNA